MAVREKDSRRIVVQGEEFRWLASGNDFGIQLVIWPKRNPNSRIAGIVKYLYEGEGQQKQIPVTNRIIRSIILSHGVQETIKSNAEVAFGRDARSLLEKELRLMGND
ncbi:MAG: hypothetical protein AAGH90_04775 [Pseudomonadota bacterium]